MRPLMQESICYQNTWCTYDDSMFVVVMGPFRHYLLKLCGSFGRRGYQPACDGALSPQLGHKLQGFRPKPQVLRFKAPDPVEENQALEDKLHETATALRSQISKPQRERERDIERDREIDLPEFAPWSVGEWDCHLLLPLAKQSKAKRARSEP